MWSIRWRLILSLGIATLVVFLVAGVSIVLLTKQALQQGVDSQLQEQVKTLINSLEVEDDELELEYGEHDHDHSENVSGFKYRVWQDGYIIGQSNDFLIPLEPHPAESQPAPPRQFDLRWSGGERMRVSLHCVNLDELGLPYVRFKGSVLTVFVASDCSWIDSTISTLFSIVVGIAVVASIFILSLVYVFTVRGLQPLNLLASEIRKIDVSQSKTYELNVPDQSIETATVVSQVQALLDRFRDVRERERAFSAEVSHELRTPLAGLASILEVTADEFKALALRDNESELQSSQRKSSSTNIEKCRTIVDSMTKMVGVLLSLNRLDGDSCQFDCTHISVLEYVEDCLAVFESKIEDRELQLTLDIDKSVQIFTDPDYFILILTNLFSNAVTYTNDNGILKISAIEADDEIKIRVQNSGANLEATDLDKVFERFWRKDEARTGGGDRFGLGLSLVQRMQRHLNGTVVAELQEPDLFSIVLSYPIVANRLAKSAE